MIWQPKRSPSLSEWHRWFAWHPVTLVDGRRAWLCYVQRKIEYGYAGWDYEYSYPSYFS